MDQPTIISMINDNSESLNISSNITDQRIIKSNITDKRIITLVME